MVAFQELFTNPSGRHVFSLALAGFIDVVVFLLAYASGPYFFGSPEQRWLAAAAALDGVDEQVLARNFLRKLGSSPQGMARVAEAELSAGERQFCLLLAAKRLAVQQEGGYLLDEAVHERLVESLAVRRLPLRAAAVQA